MKIKRKIVWLIVFFYCVLIWTLVVAIVNKAMAEDLKPDKPDYGDASPAELLQKIKRLDLTEQQRKFLKSLLRDDSTNIEKK